MQNEKRPNILWYCTDQQRFDTIEALGNPHIRTPNLNRLLQESVTFLDTYCQSPICTPSRASFMTGMYPSALSVTGNGNPVFPKHYENRLITNVLAKNGYDCGLVGKLHLASAFDSQENRVDDGYRYFQYSHDHGKPNAYGHDYADWLRTQGVELKELLNQRVVVQQPKKKTGRFPEPTPECDNIPPEYHQTRWCTDKAIEFIQKNRQKDQPWMLNVNPFDPHPGFDAPWEYYQRFDPETLPGCNFQDSDIAFQQKLTDAGIDFQSQARHPSEFDHKHVQASYYAMIEQIDHEFGRILDFLDEQNLRDNTLIIFTSDHGESLGDHGLLYKGCRFYEGLTKVPLMISNPNRFYSGIYRKALVELVDIVPTIYDMLDMEIPYYVQGKSLIQLLSTKSYDVDHREGVRCEYLGALATDDQTHATMYRDQLWKLVVYHQKGICELYNLFNDPWEHNDLSEHEDYQDKKWELMQKSFDATVYSHPQMVPRVASH